MTQDALPIMYIDSKPHVAWTTPAFSEDRFLSFIPRRRGADNESYHHNTAPVERATRPVRNGRPHECHCVEWLKRSRQVTRDSRIRVILV
jgi:hypothetical protein